MQPEHWRQRPFVPPIEIFQSEMEGPFMEHSTCSAADFLHPKFLLLCKEIHAPAVYHRKLWEWVYIAHQAARTGGIGPGKRGLVFGVGTEMLPAVFVARGARITATDAPPEIGEGWIGGDQFARSRDALPKLELSQETFEENVDFMHCDMNAISPTLVDFDFCWSSCALEHLGSLRAGMDFIINSVEKTLKVGGVACHTTEFNCSSNTETVMEGGTVIYRKRDIEELITELRDRGHEVDPLRVAPDRFTMDGWVDVPPYSHDPHLKLEIDKFVCTSVGLVIRRGR